MRWDIHKDWRLRKESTFLGRNKKKNPNLTSLNSFHQFTQIFIKLHYGTSSHFTITEVYLVSTRYFQSVWKRTYHRDNTFTKLLFFNQHKCAFYWATIDQKGILGVLQSGSLMLSELIPNRINEFWDVILLLFNHDAIRILNSELLFKQAFNRHWRDHCTYQITEIGPDKLLPARTAVKTPGRSQIHTTFVIN